jgi:hypothetical protein
MKRFKCQNCGNVLHFDNTICLNCRQPVGYLRDRFEMSTLKSTDRGWIAMADPHTPYKYCANASYDVCNWLVETNGGSALCESCRHNRIIFNLSVLSADVCFADEFGLATYYDNPNHGGMIAAHRTLAFGTRVRVYNLENDRSVDVVIVDRGPFARGRIIDVSTIAAEALGMRQAGVVRVRLELLDMVAGGHY